MRSLVVVLMLGLVACVGKLAYGDDRDAALAVIDRAIRAHGGESALAKTRYIHRLGKGAWILFGKENPFTVDTTLQLPERLRDAIEMEANGQKSRMTIVLNGGRAWQSFGAGGVELEKERIAELRDETYVMSLTTLLPLKEKTITLSAPAGSNVQGKPASAIKVTGANRPEATLFFDNQAGLLVKIERTAKQAGLSLKKEYFLEDHKEFEGVKLPTRWLESTNGNKTIDLAIRSYDFPTSVDAKMFEKP